MEIWLSSTFLVALILIPWYMQCVLSYPNYTCLLEKKRMRIKNLYGNYFQNVFPKISDLNFWLSSLVFWSSRTQGHANFATLKILPCFTTYQK